MFIRPKLSILSFAVFSKTAFPAIAELIIHFRLERTDFSFLVETENSASHDCRVISCSLVKLRRQDFHMRFFMLKISTANPPSNGKKVWI